MSAWLADPANRATFDEHLLADQSLVRESHGKVTSAMMWDRIQMLRWLFQAVCVDPHSRTVMPLREIMAEGCPHRPNAVSDLTLVTIATKDGMELGAFVPIVHDRASAGAIARPKATGRALHLDRFNFLATTSKGDFGIIGQDAPPAGDTPEANESQVQAPDGFG